MNDIQIKSLIITSILGVEFLACAFLPEFFNYFFPVIMLTLTGGLAYLIDVKKEKEDIIAKAKFFILPLLFNFGALLLIAIYSSVYVRIIYSLLACLVNYLLLVALKRVQNLEEKSAIFQRNILISAGFLTLLLSLSAVFRSYVFLSTSKVFTLPVSFVVIAVGLIYYFLLYFLSWENGLDMKKILPYNLAATLLSAEITLVGVIWIVNYPVFSSAEKANLSGFPLPAVFLVIVFYFIWGLISHKSDKSLTRRVLTEYVIISVLFLSILLATAKWLPII